MIRVVHRGPTRQQFLQQQQQQQRRRAEEKKATMMQAQAQTQEQKQRESFGSEKDQHSDSEQQQQQIAKREAAGRAGKMIPTTPAPQDAAEEVDEDFMQQMIMPAGHDLLMPTAAGAEDSSLSDSDASDFDDDDIENDIVDLVNEDILGDIDDGAESDQSDDEREPSAAELEQWAPRMLRKRVRSRGHGSLDLSDIDDAQAVDLNDIDLENKDISYEFGNAGDMPVDQRSLWSVDRKLKPDESRIFSLGLTGGHYRFVLTNSMSRSASWIRDARGLLVKFWIVNKELGHSVVRRTERVDPSSPELEFDFVIGSKDCVAQPMELRVQVISSCKHTLSRARLELRKVKLSSSYDVLAVSENTRPERCLLVQGRSATMVGSLAAAGAAAPPQPRPMPKSHSLTSLPSHMRKNKSNSRLFSFMRRNGSKAALAPTLEH